MSLSDYQARLLVSGYVGDKIKQFNLILPPELIEIIFVLYHIISLQHLSYNMNEHWDEWDDTTKHYAYEFDKITDNQTIICRVKYADGYPFMFGTKVTNSGITIWRLKARGGSRWRVAGTMYWIGFLPSSLVKKDTSDDVYEKEEALFLYWNGDIFPEDSEYKCKDLDNDKYYDFGRVDDTVCLILDTTERSVSYSVNEAPLSQIFENINISNDYKLAVCIEWIARLELQASTHLEPKVL